MASGSAAAAAGLIVAPAWRAERRDGEGVRDFAAPEFASAAVGERSGAACAEFGWWKSIWAGGEMPTLRREDGRVGVTPSGVTGATSGASSSLSLSKDCRRCGELSELASL